MPRLLRRDSVRLLEASVEALSLAILGFSMPVRHELRVDQARLAAPTGLVGASAELAMSACLVQAFGPQKLLLNDRYYKPAPEILDDFRNLLGNTPKALFLVEGVDNPTEHLQAIKRATDQFRLLITIRACGLHAGQAPSRDVCAVYIPKVCDFLSLLAKSSRIRAYVSPIPSPPHIVKDRTALLEDLARRLAASSDLAERAGLLSAVYLVLPEVPEEEPSWLDAFERLTIAPREHDIAYLLNLLADTQHASLFRVPGKGLGIPVRVTPDDDLAMHIAPQYLRTQFTQLADQWYAEVGLANAYLDKQRSLHLPPADIVLDVFAVGPKHARILPNGEDRLPADRLWPFICSSIAAHGTPGPFWFLVRIASDYDQLCALIRRACQIGSRALVKRAGDVLEGIQAISCNVPLPASHPCVERMLAEIREAEDRREDLMTAARRHKGGDKGLTEDLYQLIDKVSDGTLSIGIILTEVLKEEPGLSTVARRYWARILCEASSDEADVPTLIAVLRSPHLNVAHTAARKAVRRIDFLLHGPAWAHDSK